MENIDFTRVYKSFVLLLFMILLIIENFLLGIGSFNKIAFGLTIFLILVSLLYDIIYLKNIGQLIFILFLIIILLIFRDYTVIGMVILGLIFLNFNIETVFPIFKWIMFVLLFSGFLFCIIGLLPLVDYMGVISLGFGNENKFGAVLELYAIYSLFSIEKGQYLKINSMKRNWILFVVILLFNLFILTDSTVVITMISFVLLLLFLRRLLRFQVMKVLTIFFPVIISYFAIWLTINFNPNILWMERLNTFLTERIYIWHMYFMNSTIDLTKSSFEVNSSFFNGFFDGAYSYIFISEGWLLTLLIVFGLVLCNLELIKFHRYELLCFMLSMEIAGFSENILVNLWMGCAFIFIIMAYNPQWYRQRLKKDLL